MSAVIVVSDDLRSEVARGLYELAKFPKSIGTLIKDEHFDSVVEEVCRILDVSFEDRESALIASLARVRERIAPEYFHPRRKRPNAMNITLFGRKNKV
jgi:hypothetical protein